AVLLGYDARYAPQADLPYTWRYDRRTPDAKDEARKLADKRLQAMRASAAKEIEARALAAEERLITSGLDSDEARELVGSLPTTEPLMPSISLADLGVTTWQAARDAAKELLAIPDGAGRRRNLILRAIAQNPGASDRKIAEITGFDHKTVARYRAGE